MNQMLPQIGGLFFLFVYFCVVVGIGIYLLVLLTRFVRSHQRIAAALERMASQPPRENR